ncbi:MAG: bacillithiol system redox-active protein YtxJ [Mycobacterium leprae]
MTAVVQTLSNIEDVEAVVAQSHQKPVMIFKHSTDCQISASANRAWEEFLASPEAERVTPVFVRVIEDSQASQALSDRIKVKHQSPQAILVQNGKVLWHDAHWGITPVVLKAVLTRIK